MCAYVHITSQVQIVLVLVGVFLSHNLWGDGGGGSKISMTKHIHTYLGTIQCLDSSDLNHDKFFIMRNYVEMGRAVVRSVLYDLIILKIVRNMMRSHKY